MRSLAARHGDLDVVIVAFGVLGSQTDFDGDPELRLDDAIRRLCLLTAPKDSGYDALWQRFYD